MKRFVLAVFVACHSGSEMETSQIFTHPDQGYSVGQPEGWVISEDNGATRFTASTGRQTIIVRSTPRPKEIVEGKPTTADDVIDATEASLKRLTRDKLDSPSYLEGSELPGAQFSFTYRPPSSGMPYQRVHVVMLGKRHLFHVIQTAPLGDRLDDKSMQTMIATLEEQQ